MSQQNVEHTCRAIEAFNVRDIEACIAFCDPSIELHSTFAAVGGADYHGHGGLRTWHRDLEDAWEELRVEPEAYFDLGDQTLALYVMHGRGRNSGAVVAMPTAHLNRWRDGLMVYSKSYADRQDAVRDLGEWVDELEPIDP